jgi:hypothetical protein
MTEVLIALTRLEALAAGLQRRPPIPDASACMRQAETLFPHEAPAALPGPDGLESLRRDLQKVCVSLGAASLPMRMMRQSPAVFWDREPYAAAFPGLVDEFFARASRRDRLLREVIEAWFRDFSVDRPRFVASGKAIAALVARSNDPRLTFWHRAHQRYDVFDAERGPRALGNALLAGPVTVPTVLVHSGMDDPLRSRGRFFQTAVAELLRALPSALSKRTSAEAFSRVAPILEVVTVTQDRTGRRSNRPTLRFPDQSGDTIRAMLSPWMAGAATPVAAPRDQIKAFLLRVVGDPRLVPARWQPASEEYARLMRGWLAEASLETFFALISQTNDDPQWRYRRAFWRACLRKMPKDRPAEVWVVLGPGMAARANTVDDLAGSFGALFGSSDQAVLLIRLGDIVLSEWSNVGPVRAWRIDDRRCPPLYRATYDPDALRAPCLDFSDGPAGARPMASDGRGLWHRGPDKGVWQGRAAAFLRSHVGLLLSPQDYMQP